MHNYEIHWVTRVEDAESFAEAAKEAWSDLLQTVMEGKGATHLLVERMGRNKDDKMVAVIFDMEIPWNPRIAATSRIAADDPEVFNDNDREESKRYEEAYQAMVSVKTALRERVLKEMPIDDGGRPN